MRDPIPEPARDLLAAVLEAIDIPHSATMGSADAHDRVLNDRVMHVRIALREVLGDDPSLDIEWTTAYLREQLLKHPPTGYVSADQARAAVAAGKTWAEAVSLPEGEATR